MHVTFLLNNAYGIGGTIRSVANLSGALAARGHQVTVASLYRSRDRPSLEFDPRVTLVPLTRRNEPSAEVAERRLAAFLARTRAQVVVGTRPVLNDMLARHGDGRRYARVGQEHMTLATRKPHDRTLQFDAMRELDAFVPVSEADAAAYRAELPKDVTARVLSIPNSSPAARVAPSPGDTRTIVAAGRLVPVKRYGRLIDAFGRLAPDFPDWELRIYGRGAARDGLRERIDQLGLYNQVRLMGAAAPIETEWAKGSIAAVSSQAESFGLTIVEAMACGVPVVSTDCPHGPREIITHGEDGLLTPLKGGAEAFADALRELMTDDDRRRRMGARGLRTAAGYAPEAVARRYEDLFSSLTADRPAPRAPGLLTRLLRGGARGRDDVAPEVTAAPAKARGAGTADGGVRVTVPRTLTASELVLRLRKEMRQEEIRVPFTATPGPDGQAAEATLSPDALTLPEGRWDLFVAPRGKRLRAELVERAELVTARPRVDEHGVHAWIPYVTKNGNLTVRAWSRPAHAEVEEVVAELGTAAVVVRLYGPDGLKPDELSCRAVPGDGGGPEEEVEVDVTALDTPDDGGGAPGNPPGRLKLTLPFTGPFGPRAATAPSPAAPATAAWKLRLRTPDGTEVPVGRIGGDVPDRRGTDVFPGAGPEGDVRFGFTSDNELVVSRS
ncbi:glycosyltransferase family 4 protein [Streptomyces avicenniae]|uniref:glycosyltransferase family 4 protein n=1 Tax=Streptomyces avicenniae TaxID=500153 RepID=UPI0006998817|nr:glycosyltransferase family 4 protein [Streptomyces avicenniae]